MDDELPTYPAAPPDSIELPRGRCLVRASADRTAAVVTAVNASLDHLRPWLAWAAEPATEASIGTFLAVSHGLFEARHDFAYSILDEDGASIVGGCGLHGRLGCEALEIGYWVATAHIGRGVATDAARALTAAAFAIDGIDRVQIRCEEANVRSARVPEKLGYRFEGLVVPEEGPTAGRSTQIWSVRRRDWSSG